MKKLALLSTAALSILNLPSCSDPDVGSDRSIKDAAAEAQKYCHSGSFYEGTAIADSPYEHNEFQGAYIEDDGLSLRHIIVGSIPMEDADGGTTTVAYVCGYLQQRQADMKTVEGDIGIVSEDSVHPVNEGGAVFEERRANLREYHEVERGDGVLIHEGSHADVTATFS